MALSDYRQMEKELQRLEAQRVGQIGLLAGVRYEGWILNGRGFVLATKDGSVEIYVCGSPSTQKIEQHLAFVVDLAGLPAVEPQTPGDSSV